MLPSGRFYLPYCPVTWPSSAEQKKYVSVICGRLAKPYWLCGGDRQGRAVDAREREGRSQLPGRRHSSRSPDSPGTPPSHLTVSMLSVSALRRGHDAHPILPSSRLRHTILMCQVEGAHQCAAHEGRARANHTQPSCTCIHGMHCVQQCPHANSANQSSAYPVPTSKYPQQQSNILPTGLLMLCGPVDQRPESQRALSM